MSRPTPHSALTIRHRWILYHLYQKRKTSPEPIHTDVGCSELGEQPGRGSYFNEDALTKSYKAVSKLCWMSLKDQGNELWIQDCS